MGKVTREKPSTRRPRLANMDRRGKEVFCFLFRLVLYAFISKMLINKESCSVDIKHLAGPASQEVEGGDIDIKQSNISTTPP
jgi:hypothetical protein